jgi:hypothetical protein
MEARVTPEEYRQLQRSLMERTLDRAASDPEWKQRLLEDPQATMRESGFPEAQRLEETGRHLRPIEEEEVRGQRFDDDVYFVYGGYGFGYPYFGRGFRYTTDPTDW